VSHKCTHIHSGFAALMDSIQSAANAPPRNPTQSPAADNVRR